MNLKLLPPLNALKTFESAARHASFSRAADELFVTHGAVSRQIRALEDALGVALFSRQAGRVQLTDAGIRYARDVRVALMALADATHDVSAGSRNRRLVVSSLSSFSARWITPRIERFTAQHPDLQLELISTDRLTDFARDDVDVAIRFGSGRYAELHVEPLLDEIFFPVCAPTFNGGRLPGSPDDLSRLCLLRSEDGLWTHWFTAAGVSQVPEPEHGILYRDSWNLLQAAIGGQGIALVRRSFALSEIAAGRLVRLFEVDYPSSWAYYFVCPVPLLATPRVQAFRDWVFEEVERSCAPGCAPADGVLPS